MMRRRRTYKPLQKPNEKAITRLLGKKMTAKKQNLHALSFQIPLLLVFLRHLGCGFCHKALLDLKMRQWDIQMEGAELVLMHMAPEKEAEEVFDLYELGDIMHVSDSSKELYQAFGLERGKTKQIFNPRIWLYSLISESVGEDEINPVLGDPLQMPGVFLYHKGSIIRSFVHERITDQPDYSLLAQFPVELKKASLSAKR